MSSDSRTAPFTIARLTAADAAAFRDLRLEGLRDHPEAFGAAWQDEAAQSEAQFSARLESTVVFGSRLEDQVRLAGIVGLYRPEAPKIKHKVVLWGMYVRPALRRMGIGGALLHEAITYAASIVEGINLTVGANNASACRMYREAGFSHYGLEPRALQLDGQYYDVVLMSLELPSKNIFASKNI